MSPSRGNDSGWLRPEGEPNQNNVASWQGSSKPTPVFFECIRVFTFRNKASKYQFPQKIMLLYCLQSQNVAHVVRHMTASVLESRRQRGQSGRARLKRPASRSTHRHSIAMRPERPRTPSRRPSTLRPRPPYLPPRNLALYSTTSWIPFDPARSLKSHL